MAATSVGQIGLDLVVNQNQFTKQMSGVQNLAKKAGAALAGAFAIDRLIRFGDKCIELGSDLQEVQNVVDVTFPNMTAKVDRFAQSAAASFGLSETMAKKYTGTFGSMAKAFGFTEQAAYEMGSSLTGLAGDVASFYNLSQDEAYTKLKSVFTGETETLKDLGVVMTQSALDQYALANGYNKTTKAMSEAEKVALRYAFVQDQLSAASGDFVRTSNSWANQVKVLKLQMESLMGTLGQGFINLFTPVLKVINAIIGKLMSLANAFKAFTELITGKKSTSTGSTATESLDNATTSAENLTNATNAAGDAAAKTAKKMRQLMGFDAINKLNDNSSTDGGSSSSTSGGVPGGSFDFGTLESGETVVNELNKDFVEWFENLQKYTQPTIDSLQRLWNEGLAELGNFTWDALKGFYEEFLVPIGKWTLGEGIPRLLDATNEMLKNIDWDKLNEKLDKLWKALEPLAINLGEGLLWFYEEVLTPLGTWATSELVTRFVENLTLLLEGLNDIIVILSPALEWVWEHALKPFFEMKADQFLGEWDLVLDALEGAVSITDKLSKLGDIDVKATFKGSIDKTFESAKKTFDKLKNSTVVKTISAKTAKAWNSAKEKWNALKNSTVVKTLSAKISSSLTKFKKTWDSLKNKTLTIKANVSAAIDNIKKLINDKIIAKLNNAITTLNKLPGVEVPKIPKLAQGGYVKRNTPQLAIIGDNMRQGEVVAPEDKLLAMARQAAAMSGGVNSAEVVNILKQILSLLQTLNLVATIDVNALKKLIVRLINENTKATGVCEIIM